MDCKSIRIEAQLSFPRPIKPQFSIQYINEAMRKLCNTYDNACKKVELTVTAADTNAWYPLNSLLVKVKRVEYGDRYKYYNFQIEKGQIRFDDTGIYNVVQYVYPKSIQNEEETPEMPEAFHSALVPYCAAKERARFFGLAENTVVSLFQDFWTQAVQADKVLLGAKGTRKIMRKTPY